MRLQGSSPPVLTEDRLRELTALGRNRITQLYLHWTAGRYGELYDYYHFNIDADGSIYHTCALLTDHKPHTWGTATAVRSVSPCAALSGLCPTTAMILILAVTRPRRSKLMQPRN